VGGAVFCAQEEQRHLGAGDRVFRGNNCHLRPGEAWIAPGAAFFDSNLAYWNYGGSRLDRVTWQEADASVPAGLRFEISYWTRTGL